MVGFRNTCAVGAIQVPITLDLASFRLYVAESSLMESNFAALELRYLQRNQEKLTRSQQKSPRRPKLCVICPSLVTRRGRR